jgi:Fe-S-cluster-containing dehydrogenase component
LGTAAEGRASGEARLMHGFEFYVDPSRCIGCKSCENACAECDTHRGHTMIDVDFIDRPTSIATVPMVCMHCDDPTCAEVCPADAIKKTDDGVVQSSLKPRCVACSNCVLACPFGVPKVMTRFEQMMKCDMCYDRTSVGKRPMCATVCPSQALAYGTPETIARDRRESPTNVFVFGNQRVTTKVYYMVPPATDEVRVDVVDYMWEGA